jgi:monovalent cation:H+ antiporter-2, CPA2 family
MEDSLQLILILLLAAVLVVIVFRLLKLPALIGYLLVGVAIGPRGLGLIPDTAGTRGLAEFGVVFLMFSIGLEFSLARLATMRRIVFGLGASQVALTLAIVVTAAFTAGMDWRIGVVLGGALAMSSTAIVSKMLAEKLELNTLHGRQVIGVLLFQDLAVVPLLILIPALAQPPAELAAELLFALLKAAAVLSILLYLGQRPMRAWFHLVARQKSSELFVRHADLRDRVPLSGRRRHQTVPRCAARVVFRHGRHETRHPPGAREPGVGRACIGGTDRT